MGWPWLGPGRHPCAGKDERLGGLSADEAAHEAGSACSARRCARQRSPRLAGQLAVELLYAVSGLGQSRRAHTLKCG